MKFKILKVLAFGLFFALFFNSCAAGNLSRIKKDKIPVKSFVKVTYKSYRRTCTPAKLNDFSSPCYTRVGMGSGSGVIFAHSIEGSYIMTAAHICDPERIPEWMITYSMPEEDIEILKKSVTKIFFIND